MQLHDDSIYGPITLFKPPRANTGSPAWIARKGTRTISERHPVWEWKIDSTQSKGYICTVAGCGRRCEDFSARLCLKHRNWERHHGDPTAGNLPRKLLGNWIVLAERYIHQLDALEEGHPARAHLALARHWFNSSLSRAKGYVGASYRPGESHETRWNRYLANLTRHGITVNHMLALGTAFYMARAMIPGMCAESDKHERFQFARLILLTVTPKRPEWRGGYAEKPGLRFMLWAGERFQKALGLFSGYAAQALLGDPWGGYPSLEDNSPVAKSTAMKAARRPWYRPPNNYDDDEQDN
jgi:hypothetical protein